MAQTPLSSSDAYCDAATLLRFVAPQIMADVLRSTPEAPRPSYLAMIDPANPAGQRLLTYLQAGAGEIEAKCFVSKRYVPADLQALTGVARVFLQRLNAARAVWQAYQYLKPGSARPEDCPGAKESAEYLDLLGRGEAIFGLVETMRAGLPSVVQAQPNRLLTPNIVGLSYRLLPNYGQNRLSGQGD